MEYELPHDPVILVGTINMKLRDFYSDLDQLCDDLELDKDALNDTLNSAGFRYDAKSNQFHSEK